ncbi:MAG: hypothetical protein R6V11_01770 [Ectothiorhodospiraceae bacterium]
MTARRQNDYHKLELRLRERHQVSKSRPCHGEHHEIVQKALVDTLHHEDDTLRKLSKV